MTAKKTPAKAPAKKAPAKPRKTKAQREAEAMQAEAEAVQAEHERTAEELRDLVMSWAEAGRRSSASAFALAHWLGSVEGVMLADDADPAMIDSTERVRTRARYATLVNAAKGEDEG